MRTSRESGAQGVLTVLECLGVVVSVVQVLLNCSIIVTTDLVNFQFSTLSFPAESRWEVGGLLIVQSFGRIPAQH